MTKQPAKGALPVHDQPTSPDWVNDMHDYFRNNGFFRAEDLRRVLGDPRDRVELGPTTEFPLNLDTEKIASGS